MQREAKNGGHGFNGNACKQLLDKVDILRATCTLGCLKFVKVLDDFRKVVDSCFGTVLDPAFTRYINRFKESYLALHISVTPKAHVIFFHVPQFCTRYNKALGFYNEQAMESIHYEFKSFWQKYQVNRKHKEYPQRCHNSRFLNALILGNEIHVTFGYQSSINLILLNLSRIKMVHFVFCVPFSSPSNFCHSIYLRLL